MKPHLNDLLDYTDWERQKWHGWFEQHGEQALTVSAGPHGDGRFAAVGELIRHVFCAEKRYIEKLSDRPLTDPASIAADDVEALFQFSRESRRGLREFMETFPDEKWDESSEYRFLGYFLRATPRKIVVHILLHEIRHWAQIATLLRLNGLAVEFHDFLASPVMGGEFKRE
jgi:uncharacterized damage-inducible protein DinB